jgi:hypothetical protein
MKTASVNELKKELHGIDPQLLVELCLKLIKYKKENKELITYLLFEEQDETVYIRGVKNEMDIFFEELNKSNMYVAKKGLQKILRHTSKFIKYSGKKETEIELLLHFCLKVKRSGIKMSQSTVITNLFFRQIKKIEKAISYLHEDLQYDYQQELNQLG